MIIVLKLNFYSVHGKKTSCQFFFQFFGHVINRTIKTVSLGCHFPYDSTGGWAEANRCKYDASPKVLWRGRLAVPNKKRRWDKARRLLAVPNVPKNWFGCFISTAFLGARVNIFDNIQPELCSGRSCVTTEAWPQKFYLKGRPSTIVEDSSGEVIVQEGDYGNECGSTEELWWVYSEVWSVIR